MMRQHRRTFLRPEHRFGPHFTQHDLITLTQNSMEQRTITWGALVLAIIALVVAVMPRNSPSTATTDDTLARIQKTGSVDVCVIVSPPQVIKDATTGEYSGYMFDAMKAIVDRIGGADMRVTETTYGTGVADLQSRRCDIVVADYFANIPRAATVAFTTPALFFMGQSGIIRRNDPRFTNVKDIMDFDRPNITVAVATGDTGDVFVKENFTQAQIRRIDVEAADLTRFALEVSAGRADVAISDVNTIALFAKAHPEVTDLFATRPFGLNPVGWAVRQSDTAWLHFLETSLQFLETQGILKQLEQKYNAHWLQPVREYRVR